jgi:23S rRNA (cytosine1962-C5)-methyltransferase
MSLPIVELKKDREKTLNWHHPWVFSGAIARVAKGTKPGDLVQVLDSEGRVLSVRER